MTAATMQDRTLRAHVRVIKGLLADLFDLDQPVSRWNRSRDALAALLEVARLRDQPHADATTPAILTVELHQVSDQREAVTISTADPATAGTVLMLTKLAGSHVRTHGNDVHVHPFAGRRTPIDDLDDVEDNDWLGIAATWGVA